MKRLLSILLVLLSTGLLSAEPSMTKLVVRNVTPGVKADSGVTLPRTIYRQGDSYARVEESPSPDGTHLLIIRALDESWQIDLAKKAGTHRAGLPREVRVPVYVDLYALEFGQELEFMKKYQVEPEEFTLKDGQLALRYGARAADIAVELLVLKEGELPLAIQFFDPDDTVLLRIEYLNYQRGLSPDPTLFAPPEGTTLEEVE